MAYDHYGETPDQRREFERERGQRGSNRGEDRGFFEQMGDEVRSWFGGDDDDRSRGNMDRSERGYGRQDYGRGYSESQGSRGRSSMQSGGRYGSGGGMSSGRSGGDRWSIQSGDRWSSPAGSGGNHSGRGLRDDDSIGFDQGMSDTLGGFGNQRFGSTEQDHYRSWRDRQMQQLDNDYKDYCREREQQFHSDFDKWRSSRKGQSSMSDSNSSSSNQGSSGSGGFIGSTADQGSSESSIDATSASSGKETASAATGSRSGSSRSRS